MEIQNSLERYYKSCVERTDPLAFYKGLKEYLDYVFATPDLKEAFEYHLKERNNLYIKYLSREKATIKEMKVAANTLLRKVKETGVNPDEFEIQIVGPMRPFYNNLVEELIAHKDNKVQSIDFWTEQVERYLFEIAFNLTKMGHGNAVKQYLVKRDDFGHYHIRVNRPTNFYLPQEEEGRHFFIFSKTLPEFSEQKRLIENSRHLRPWGSIEKLYQFRIAYDHSVTEVEPWAGFAGNDTESYFIEKVDAVKVRFMRSEIEPFLENLRAFNTRPIEPLEYLALDKLRHALNTAHNFLMRPRINSNNQQSKTKIYIHPRKGIYSDSSHLYSVIGKRRKCIELLLEHDYCTGADFTEIWPSTSRISNEIADINKTFNEKLGTKKPIIIHYDGSGYCLNREDFEIVVEGAA